MKGEGTYRTGLSRRWRSFIESADCYGVRVQCMLIASLSVMLLISNVPLGAGSDAVGWYVANRAERLTIELVETPSPQREDAGAPITRIEQNVPDDLEDEGVEPPEDVDDARPLPEMSDLRKSLKRLAGRKVLDFAETMPQIVGGMGAYYIHITYPEAAVEAGVEGRLVLSFVVDTVGYTNEIEIVESLHPACDSAAVQALRITRFVPGRQNGRTVPVRMRLPVRFKLLKPEGPEESDPVDS